MAKTQAIKQKIEEAQPGPRFVRTLTNVQVELTLTDQTGSGTPDKKTVSMVVSSGNWGRSGRPGTCDLQARRRWSCSSMSTRVPLSPIDGPIQLELTLNYSPPGAQSPDQDNARARPTSINQSLTVVLQSGKPMVISQAADPVNDRKVLVEVKATVLK